MAVTAKVKCASREFVQEGEVRVTFSPNYTDDNGERVNTEWAKYTPGLQLSMVVLDTVPFTEGKNYTLTFEED